MVSWLRPSDSPGQFPFVSNYHSEEQEEDITLALKWPLSVRPAQVTAKGRKDGRGDPSGRTEWREREGGAGEPCVRNLKSSPRTQSRPFISQ